MEMLHPFKSVSGCAFSSIIIHSLFVPKSTILESCSDIIPEVQSEGSDKSLSDRINPKKCQK